MLYNIFSCKFTRWPNQMNNSRKPQTAWNLKFAMKFNFKNVLIDCDFCHAGFIYYSLKTCCIASGLVRNLVLKQTFNSTFEVKRNAWIFKPGLWALAVTLQNRSNLWNKHFKTEGGHFGGAKLFRASFSIFIAKLTSHLHVGWEGSYSQGSLRSLRALLADVKEREFFFFLKRRWCILKHGFLSAHSLKLLSD